ncbi:hypothetical protein EDD15DRAFT_2132393, partial [Pisolithus albus]
KKLLWSLNHIMCSDTCHCATFGVTIENTKVRFWYTFGAATLVSEDFDIIKEEELVYLFCSLALASDHDLGWYLTIQR